MFFSCSAFFLAARAFFFSSSAFLAAALAWASSSATSFASEVSDAVESASSPLSADSLLSAGVSSSCLSSSSWSCSFCGAAFSCASVAGSSGLVSGAGALGWRGGRFLLLFLRGFLLFLGELKPSLENRRRPAIELQLFELLQALLLQSCIGGAGSGGLRGSGVGGRNGGRCLDRGDRRGGDPEGNAPLGPRAPFDNATTTSGANIHARIAMLPVRRPRMGLVR